MSARENVIKAVNSGAENKYNEMLKMIAEKQSELNKKIAAIDKSGKGKNWGDIGDLGRILDGLIELTENL